MWFEMQVWLGVTVQNEKKKHRVSSYHIGPVRERGRQVTRLIRREYQQAMTPDRQRLDARWYTSEGGGSR